MPWCSDGPAEAEIGGHMETTLAHWADEAHAQGGWVISPHFPNPNGESAALVATGRLDGVEMLRQSRLQHMEYYRYLNCGYRLPLVGGTDKMMSNVPVGPVSHLTLGCHMTRNSTTRTGATQSSGAEPS